MIFLSTGFVCSIYYNYILFIIHHKQFNKRTQELTNKKLNQNLQKLKHLSALKKREKILSTPRNLTNY